MGLLHSHTVCLSIRCPSCDGMLSGSTKRGFKDFILTHINTCDVGSFSIQESIDVELVIQE